jgi:hypothetical protein
MPPTRAPADPAAAQYQAVQQTLTDRTAQAVLAWWAQMEEADLSGSWLAGIGARMLAAVMAGQSLAARTAGPYVAARLAVRGVRSAPAARVNPAGFAGTASDGRDLGSLLYVPVIGVKQQIAGGMPPADALKVGSGQLERIVRTQVQDAGRVAAGVAQVAEPKILGYSRRLVGSSCSRCIVLAGRVYRWNEGFDRHPNDDCVHVPLTAEEFDRHETDIANNPRRHFDSLSRAEQDRLFTAAGAQVIRDGADISQVVNARRGMTKAGTTTEGTTRRGFAGKRLGGGRGRRAAQLMPEAIYEQTGDDRGRALELLHQHGYIL